MKQEFEAYWDNYRFPEHFMQGEGEPFDNPVRVLISALSAHSDSVLDVGCASCISYPLFRNRDRGYVGVDFTKQFLKVASKNYSDVPVVCGYAVRLPFRDGAFDTVFIKDVLEHVAPDVYKTIISEMWRVAKKQILLAFYGHLNKPKIEQLREPDEHNEGVPPYKGGTYYFNAYGRQDVIDTITKLPNVHSYDVFEGIQREKCPEDKIGRTLVVVRKVE